MKILFLFILLQTSQLYTAAAAATYDAAPCKSRALEKLEKLISSKKSHAHKDTKCQIDADPRYLDISKYQISPELEYPFLRTILLANTGERITEIAQQLTIVFLNELKYDELTLSAIRFFNGIIDLALELPLTKEEEEKINEVLNSDKIQSGKQVSMQLLLKSHQEVCPSELPEMQIEAERKRKIQCSQEAIKEALKIINESKQNPNTADFKKIHEKLSAKQIIEINPFLLQQEVINLWNKDNTPADLRKQAQQLKEQARQLKEQARQLEGSY